MTTTTMQKKRKRKRKRKKRLQLLFFCQRRVKKSRFIKSYKYKHKLDCWPNISFSSATQHQIKNPPKNSSCDLSHVNCNKRQKLSPTPLLAFSRLRSLIISLICVTVTILSTGTQQTVNAFCPFKCLCDDQSLSANCTRIPSIGFIPMTLNPLLKQLTLNHLPMTELSNSLSVYRQLEYLNLNSNQLKQVKYENFNFKSAPASLASLVSSAQSNSMMMPSSNFPDILHQEIGINNEQLARHLRLTIDKSLTSGESSGSTGGGVGAGAGAGGSSGSPEVAANIAEDEIRFHVRELSLADNKIEELGSLSEQEERELEMMETESIVNRNGDSAHHRRLKSTDIERLAPFLTLSKLEILNLSGNRLGKLHQHVFLGLLNLKELDLSRNNVEFIDKHAFVGLIELRTLRLNRNRLARHLQHLGLSFCRAPMNELRVLDLSDNYHPRFNQRVTGELLPVANGQPQPTTELFFLPNQMFICTPRLISLRLESLQLRYIQVNAFDNLQALERLYLARNQLEQVPKDSLTFSNSNLSFTLRELDLSETLIEFVNARSFSSLKSLQRLSLNSMPRLVSFDLASVSLKVSGFQETDEEQSSRIVTNQETTNEQASNQISSSLKRELVNDQLLELRLRQNLRLQSLHSSLGNRISFSRLRLLDLEGALELREFPLEEMIDFTRLEDNLRLDLSLVSKLNCSSCQMSWLVEVAREQHRLTASVTNPQTQSQSPTNTASSSDSSKISLSSLESVGCSWPFAMPLLQLLELDTTFAPIFLHCTSPVTTASNVLGPNEQQQRWQDWRKVGFGVAQQEGSGAASSPSLSQGANTNNSVLSAQLSWLASSLLVFLGLLCAGGTKFLLRQQARRRAGSSTSDTSPAGFKWRSAGLLSCSPAQSSSSQAADCSSSSILSAAGTSGGRPVYQEHFTSSSDREPAVSLRTNQQHRLINFKDLNENSMGQIEQAHWEEANLFSRIVGRLRAACRKPLTGDRMKVTTVCTAKTHRPNGRQETLASGRVESRILGQAVYTGKSCEKISAFRNSETVEDAVRQQFIKSAAQQQLLSSYGRFRTDSEAQISSSGGFIYSRQDAANPTSCYFNIAPRACELISPQASERQQQCKRLQAIEIASQVGRQTARTCQFTDLRVGDYIANSSGREVERHFQGATLGQHKLGQVSSKCELPVESQQVHLGSFCSSKRKTYSAQLKLQEQTSQVGALDGHIYVTLDGPIKQEGEERDECSNKLYEAETLPQQQQQIHRQQQQTSGGSIYESKRVNQLESLEANCPATLDYKSFEWPQAAECRPSRGESSSPPSSSCDSTYYLSSFSQPLRLTKEDEKFKERGSSKAGSSALVAPCDSKPEPELNKMASGTAQLERQLAKQLNKLSFQIEGKNRQQDARETNNNSYNSTSNSTMHSAAHLRNTKTATAVAQATSTENRQETELNDSKSNEETAKSCCNKMEMSEEKWLSHNSDLKGGVKSKRSLKRSKSRQLAGRPLCALDNNSSNNSNNSNSNSSGSNVTGHTDYEQQRKSPPFELKKEDGEGEVMQLFMSANGRPDSETRRITPTRKLRTTANDDDVDNGQTSTGRAQYDDANHGSPPVSFKLASESTRPHSTVSSSMGVQFNYHVINGLQLQRPAAAAATVAAPDSQQQQQQLVGPKLIGVSPLGAPGNQCARKSSASAAEIMIGQRNSPSSLSHSLDNSSSNLNSNAQSSTFSNRLTSLDERTTERECCDYSNAQQQPLNHEQYQCDIPSVVESEPAASGKQIAAQQSHSNKYPRTPHKLISDNKTDQATNSANEIYSNQFYYYSPSKLPPTNRHSQRL